MEKTKRYYILSVVSILLLLIGTTLAYFSARIEGDTKTVTVNTAYLRVIFTDTNEAIEINNLKPGESIPSKTFTVENKSGEAYNYNIIIKNLVNTFQTSGYLQYQIVGEDGGVSKGWTNVPKSNVATDTVLYYSVPLAVGVTHSYTVNFRYLNDENVDQSDDMNKTFSGSLYIARGTETPANALAEKILIDNNATVEANVPTRSDFANEYTSTSTTFFKTNNAENGDTVYYYAGGADNNWVIFGTCPAGQDWCTSGDDLYWRIIRTNEAATGGGVRLLYSGSGSTSVSGKKTVAAVTNAYVTERVEFNSVQLGVPAVGYMYSTDTSSLAGIRGNANSSTAKTAVDNWYVETFVNANAGLSSKISTTAVYCNDRSVAGVTASSDRQYYLSYHQLDDYYDGIIFGPQARKTSPSYACGTTQDGYGNYFEGGNDIADKYSATATAYGNGYLTYPAALITFDEAVFAGSGSTVVRTCFGEDGNGQEVEYACERTSSIAWLGENSEKSRIMPDIYGFWTLSPSGSGDIANVYKMNVLWHDEAPLGELYAADVDGADCAEPRYEDGTCGAGRSTSTRIRPVISLTSDTIVSGTGLASDPYIVAVGE